jgi:glycosyltransferase involved in cell wall biosynthesis
MNQPLLTVSIPTWNRALLVKELLQQVCDEVLQHNLQGEVDILVSNNASTDNTDEVIQPFLSRYSFIQYNRNVTNTGAKSNVLKSMELANGKYVLFMGDDDRIKQGALSKIIALLQQHPDCGTLIDHADFKRKYFQDGDTPSLTEFLQKHFWNMGNAGFFIPRTDYFKEYLAQYGYDFFNECWPQSQIQILGLFKHPEHKIYIESISIHAESLHGEVMQYTSFYLWRTCYYELFLSAQAIRKETSEGVFQACRTYLKNSLIQQLFNILQCGIFVDTNEQKQKTRQHIASYLNLFSFKENVLLGIIIIGLWLPSFIAKPLANTAIFLLKGNGGIQAKNTFVNNELAKRIKKQQGAIRQLEFEK